MSSERPHLRGIPFDRLDLPALVEAIGTHARTDRMAIVSTINLDFMRVARQNTEFLQLLRTGTWRNVVDGWPVATLLQRAGGRFPTAPGSDLIPALLADARTAARGLYFLGDTHDTHALIRERGVREGWIAAIRGAATPSAAEFESEEDSRAIVAAINASGAGILCLALGSPRQEFWLRRWQQELQPAVGIGVGAALRFLGSPDRRAPSWMRRLRLEWAHRLLLEPGRLGPRYAADVVELLRLLTDRSAVT